MNKLYNLENLGIVMEDEKNEPEKTPEILIETTSSKADLTKSKSKCC